MDTYKLFKKAGDPTDGLPPDFAHKVWEGTPILQYRSFEEWYMHTLQEIVSVDRCEYIVVDSEQVIASMCFQRAVDQDVGDAMMVRFAYSSVKGALAPAYHWMKHVAMVLNVPTMVTTKLIKDNKYEITYKKLKTLDERRVNAPFNYTVH